MRPGKAKGHVAKIETVGSDTNFCNRVRSREAKRVYDEFEAEMHKYIIVPMVHVVTCITAFCDVAEDRLRELEESAVFAGLSILKHSTDIIPFARDVVTNACVYSSGLRGSTYIRLLDICTQRYADMYINDPEQEARIASFFLERAAVEQEDTLFIDRCAHTLNPTYRHSQQRRDNLAALRPPNLTGKPAELYGAAQADAAQED